MFSLKPVHFLSLWKSHLSFLHLYSCWYSGQRGCSTIPARVEKCFSFWICTKLPPLYPHLGVLSPFYLLIFEAGGVFSQYWRYGYSLSPVQVNSILLCSLKCKRGVDRVSRGDGNVLLAWTCEARHPIPVVMQGRQLPHPHLLVSLITATNGRRSPLTLSPTVLWLTGDYEYSSPFCKINEFNSFYSSRRITITTSSLCIVNGISELLSLRVTK